MACSVMRTTPISIERQVLSVWDAGRKRFTAAAGKLPAQDQPIVARTRKYLDLLTSGRILYVQALREHPGKAAQAHAELEAADEALQMIWGRPKSTSSLRFGEREPAAAIWPVPELLALSNRVIVQREGRIVGELTRSQSDPVTGLAAAPA